MARIVALFTVGAALALGVLASGTVTAAGAASAPACGPSSGRTLAAGALSRVYVAAGTVYGCTRGSPPRRLGRVGPCQGPGSIGRAAVSGRDAAVALTVCGVDTGAAMVEVIRLSDGRTLSSHAAAPVTAPESFTSVEGLVLVPDGTVAWIGHAASIVRHASLTGVYAAAAPRTAPVRTLDSGPGVAAGSLRLAGRTVSWRDSSGRRHAQL